VHRRGVAALYALRFSRELKLLKRQLALDGRALEAAADFGGVSAIKEKIIRRITEDLFARDLRTRSDFENYARSAAARIFDHGRRLLDAIQPVLCAYAEARGEILRLQATGSRSPGAAAFFSRLLGELRRLVPESFLEIYATERLTHLVRYVRALGIRAQRAAVDFEKDRAKSRSLEPFARQLDELLARGPDSFSEEKRRAIAEYFWMLEEYRVSVFAQELKTAIPVSPQKLDAQWKKIERML